MSLCPLRAENGGREASDVRRMRELEAENRKLRQMYAELRLENVMLSITTGSFY
jgi:putative transposase